ncbi:alpha/beta hydrolase [Winogradskyella sp. A2]|uniref:alpha/beta hydrolase n=1 Tax=Winogradskyella sp. A2 TaxID=3366944 RepID=UPI00398C4CB2
MRFKRFLLIIGILFLTRITAQSTASKQVTKFVIEAPQLDTTKQIWVYLPKKYENFKKHYPVIYMHDAQNLFDNETSYVGEWKVDEYLDSLNNNESIIIGIEHGNEKRIDELTPYSHAEYGGGKGENYLSFIKHTLKPKIDSIYRTLPQPSNTTLFGSSLGGLISLYGVIKHSDTFGMAGLFSPAFWINPEIYKLVENTNIPKTSKFYFLVGTAEDESMVPNQIKMIELLKTKGVLEHHISNNIVKDGQHNEQFWSKHFGEAYQWLHNNAN